MLGERIYIGGLHPKKVTASDVVDRLKSLDGVEIGSIVDTNKFFVHLTAISKTPDSSALEVISKKYHNVKWKGCKLEVLAARPSFMERLEEERRQRAEQELKKEETAISQDETPQDEENKESLIPRRLRVRKKHGHEAYHVDTKPWSVDSFYFFKKAVGKLRLRTEKHEQKNLEEKKKANPIAPVPLMHRAVHIRFKKEDVVIKNGGIDQVDSDQSSEASGDEDVLIEGSDESSSSENEAADKEDAKAKKTSSYAWSDDDSDDDSEDEESGASIDANESIRKHTMDLFEDEESDQDMNEFSAGLDLENDKEDESGMDDTEENDHRVVDQTGSGLVNDVAANLDILSSLFPGMTDTKPAIPESDSEEENSKAEKKNVTARSAYGSAGPIMPRYDPKDESTQKYVVHDDEVENQSSDDASESSNETAMKKEEGDDDDDSMSDQDSSDDDDDDDVKEEDHDKKGDDGKEPGDSIIETTPIYEEGKLENVFREARNAWQGKTQTLLENEPSAPSSGGGFSFGFDLGEPTSNDQPKDDNSGGFSFAFNVPGQGAQNESTAATQNTDEPREASELQDMDVEAKDAMKESSESRRRIGLRIPKDKLEMYQSDFFACNEGTRIMEDLEGFRNDVQVQEHWKAERQTLTLDWKRKRKHAQSRIQKRMKIR
jgi:hypothetical protein